MIQARAQPVPLFCPGLPSLDTGHRRRARFVMSTAGAVWEERWPSSEEGVPNSAYRAGEDFQSHAFAQS